MINPRPHFKHAKVHRKDCRCLACKIWRQQQLETQALRDLEKAERNVSGN